MQEYKSFTQRIGLIGIINLIVSLSPIILLPILTKNLNIVDYGIWVQISITITLIQLFSTLGVNFTLVRFMSSKNSKAEIREIFYSLFFVVFIVAILLGLIFLLFSNSLSEILFNGELFVCKLVAILIIIASINFFLINYFRALLQMKKFSFFLFIQAYLNLFLVALLVVTGYGIAGAVIGYLISQIVLLILMLILIIYQIGFAFPKFKNLKNYLLFGLPTVPSTIAIWISNSSDRYMISYFLGVSFVGYYSPAYTLGYLIILFMYPFQIILLPTMNTYYNQDNPNKAQYFLDASLKYYFALAIPAVFGISFLAKPLLGLLTTTEIASSYYITPFIAISALFFGIYMILSNLFLIKKRTKIMAIIWIISAAINLVLNILFIPTIGIFGAAISTLISYSLVVLMSVLYLNKFFKITFNKIFILKCILASCIMSIVIMLIEPTGFLNILISILIAALVYFIILILLKGITKQELRFFEKMIKN